MKLNPFLFAFWTTGSLAGLVGYIYAIWHNHNHECGMWGKKHDV